MATKKDLIKFCRLYKGELSIEDNPFDKADDEFKFEMWRVEFAAIHDALKFDNIDEAEEYIKDYIRNKINVFASVPFGGDASPYYDKYFNY